VNEKTNDSITGPAITSATREATYAKAILHHRAATPAFALRL
jgi:hypothetical protein